MTREGPVDSLPLTKGNPGVPPPMNTGDTVTDGQKRSWRVGQALGRGLWGSSWVIRGDDEREWVLKVPHADADLPSDAPVPAGLVEACAAAARETGALYRDGGDFLPRVEDVLQLPDGRPALRMVRYPGSLARRLEAGLPLGEALKLALAVIARLGALGRPHGDLRPSNVLLNDRGDVVLADPLPPAIEGHATWLRAHLGRQEATPPEAAGAPDSGWDTWALCLFLWRAAMTGADAAPPREGLSKVQLATVKDRALARLKQEQANPRFVARVAERLASLLNRGLSHEVEPSPPYRFARPADLAPRIEEVSALVHPRVESVGRLLLASSATGEVFQGGEDVAFSVTIGCSEGVADHEHVACGVQVSDLDEEDDPRVKVPEARYGVQTHPSGRMRFQFTLPDLAPGRYRARVAFAVKDSGEEPQVAEGEFEVRPPPGWIPPAEAPRPPEPVPLPLRPRGAAAPPAESPVVADADVFPTPIRPSSAGPGSPVAEVEHEPTVADLPSMDPPPRAAVPPRPSPAAEEDPDTQPSLSQPAPWSHESAGAAARADDPTPVAPPPRSFEGTWEDDLPAPDDGADDWVPGSTAGEDLPDWEQGERERLDVNALVQRGVEILRRDAWAFLLVAFALILGFVFVLSWILRALFF